MILVIDNYDSFTYNLVQLIGELGFYVKVVRNNKLSLRELDKMQPTHIILSPGPGSPEDSGISLDIISNYQVKIPILGVCLGHQSIGYTFSSMISQLDKPAHGKISKVYHNNKDIFYNLPNPFYATRYHSLVIDNNSISDNLLVTARTDKGIIMGCRHKYFPKLRGIQFHPESLWTDTGKNIVGNFLYGSCK